MNGSREKRQETADVPTQTGKAVSTSGNEKVKLGNSR